MSIPALPQFDTRRMRLPVPFDVLDPATGQGRRIRILVDVNVPEDGGGSSTVDGVYTDVGRGTRRAVTYYRVGDVGFAPIRDACLGSLPDMLHGADPGRQLNHLEFDGRYALPTRFNEAFAIPGLVHTLTGAKISRGLHDPPSNYEDLMRAGHVVAGWEERAGAIREAASRCFLIRRDVGLCMASIPPVWGVFESGGVGFVQLYMVSPERGHADVFDIRRPDAAVAFARARFGGEPEVTGVVDAMASLLPAEDDAAAAFAGHRLRFARLLKRSLADLQGEGVRLWHDSVQAPGNLRSYGSAPAMLALLDRVGTSLENRPDARDNWDIDTKDLRRRLSFEAGHAPATTDAEILRP